MTTQAVLRMPGECGGVKLLWSAQGNLSAIARAAPRLSPFRNALKSRLSVGAVQERIAAEKHRPDFSIEQVQRDYLVFDKRCLDRLLTGLREAGVPEC